MHMGGQIDIQWADVVMLSLAVTPTECLSDQTPHIHAGLSAVSALGGFIADDTVPHAEGCSRN